ncbi:MAG TPA: hypothetical protein PLW86_00975 [Rhodocyclaceae bacterium]|nr:hypothetical protein [Rhodocyclaceae bacterium]
MLATFAVFGVIVALAFGIMLRFEYTTLRARGKSLAWWVVRLATIPMLVLCATLVILPARATSGMEGLAVFYLLLFTAAPLVWFGLHWLLGKLTRPSLSGSESFALALTIPSFAIAVALLAHQVQSLAFSLDRQFKPQPPSFEMIEGQPYAPVHTLQYTKRYVTVNGDFFVSRWRSPQPVSIERVDWIQGPREINYIDRQRAMNFCRDGADLVILEPAELAPGYLRVHWRSAGSPLYRSDLTTRDNSAVAQPLIPTWADDRVTLSETFPRYSLAIGRLRADGKPDYARDESGASPVSDPSLFHCLPKELKTASAPAGVYLTISRMNGDVMTAEIKRPTRDPE